MPIKTKKRGSALIKVKPFFAAKCDSAGLWIRTKNVSSHHLLLRANKSDSVSRSQLASTKHWDRLIFHKAWYFSRHWQTVLHILLKPRSRPTRSKMLFPYFSMKLLYGLCVQCFNACCCTISFFKLKALNVSQHWGATEKQKFFLQKLIKRQFIYCTSNAAWVCTIWRLCGPAYPKLHCVPAWQCRQRFVRGH